MAAKQHTPGPWAYDSEINRVYSVATNICVAAPHIASNPTVMEEWPADARLIAAAPDLYEALDEAINYLAVWAATAHDATASALLDRCTTALTKAKAA